MNNYIDLDQAFWKSELAHPLEVGDRLGRQDKAVPSGELGDALPVPLPLSDLLA